MSVLLIIGLVFLALFVLYLLIRFGGAVIGALADVDWGSGGSSGGDSGGSGFGGGDSGGGGASSDW